MILGKIGDARALPVLTNLKQIDNGIMRHYVDEAIKRIQDKRKSSK